MHTIILAGTVVLLAVVPGLIVGYLARMPWHLALGFAVPVTYGMVAVGTYLTGVVTVPWNLATAAGTLLVFMALAVLYRVVLARYGKRDDAAVAEQSSSPSQLPDWPWLAVPGVGVVVGFGTILYILADSLLKAVDGVNNVPSGWDSHWHGSVMTFIDETGIASAVQLGRLMNVETHGALYYPDAWHALNALLIPLTGSTTVQVFNISSIVTVALVIPLSVGALAWRIVRDRMAPAPAALSAGIAAGISGMFPALPYVEIGVGAVPFAIGVGLAGLVAVLVMAVPGAPSRIPLAALGLIGLAAIHPSGALVAGMMVGAWWLLDVLIRPRRGRLLDLGSLAAVGILTAIVLAPQILGVLGEVEEIESFDFVQPIPRMEAFGHVISQQGWDLGTHSTPWVLLALGLLGAVILLALRSWWWLAMWGGLVLLATNSMVPFGEPWADLLFKFSNSFYNDARRLGYPQAVLMITVAGCALGMVLWFAFQGFKKLDSVPQKVRAGGLAAVVLFIFGAAIWQVPELSTKMQPMLHMDRTDRMVSAGDREAFAFLAEQPDAMTTTIFNDPATGTGWAYSLNGLHMAFNHYFWPAHVGTRQWDVWVNLRDLGNPAEPERSDLAEKALRDLDVKYVIMSSPVFWHFQEVAPGLRELDQTPGLTEIYNNGETQIYRVETWRPAAPGEVRVGWAPFDDREGITSDYERPELQPGWVPPEGTG
ncbi:DUF6541 family protein [Tomitella biformata]|uniref:DUF6541 family protein n=1 Tax=Tomitella biformata TaxID=630403 RepID=UPI0004B41D4B|nr:DUF6541 family protein [Tomitella biformata]